MTNAHQPLAHSSTEIRWPGRTLGLMRKASFAGNGRLFGLELARTCREQNESRLWTRIIGRQKKMTVQVVFHDRAHMTGRCMLSTLLLRNLERVQNRIRHAVRVEAPRIVAVFVCTRPGQSMLCSGENRVRCDTARAAGRELSF